MRLKVLLPTEVLIDREVVKIVAEAENGLFAILPRHVDFAAALVPSLLCFEEVGGGEVFLAVDEGILVKCGREVLVSTRRAVRGADLGHLTETIVRGYRALDDRERKTRSAMARLEAGFVRRFVEFSERGHE